MKYVWRILRDDEEVGRVIWEDGQVSYVWPADWLVVGEEIEAGTLGWLNIAPDSVAPRPELARAPAYIHDMICIHFEGPFRVETNYRGTTYPTHDENGNRIYY